MQITMENYLVRMEDIQLSYRALYYKPIKRRETGRPEER
jgi:hypothetical protein